MVGTCKQVVQIKQMRQGRSARAEPTPSPAAPAAGVTAPLPTGRHSSPAGALAQPPGVSAFSSPEVGAWNRCEAT